jgi:hypothetical protein
MTVVLGLLADFAWILYAACGLTALVYVFRALALQRELGVSLTAFEKETLTLRIAKMWRMAVVFVMIGVALIAVQVYLLPRLPQDELEEEPTPVGVITSTPSPTPLETPILGVLPTITVTIPPPPPTLVPPTATPTVVPGPGIAVGVTLGNVAQLVGYDVDVTEVVAGQPVGLTLYWRALEGAASGEYSVFNHMVSPPPDVRMIAQHDGVPVGGTRPTSSWVAGELIEDYHQLVFKPEELGFLGVTELRVGLYDPTVNVAVPAESGAEYIILPTVITVVSP